MLLPPYGGQLVDLTVLPEEAEALREHAATLPSLQLSERALCDLELLATGGFSPLDRFMGKEDYRHVLEAMRLASGHLFPIPVTLPVEGFEGLHLDRDIALRNAKNELLGVMTVEEIYEWDREEMALAVFGTRDPRHPLVAELHRWGRFNVSGRLQLLQLPRHHTFMELWLTPRETRERLHGMGRRNVIAFQPEGPLYRPQEEMTRRAMEEVDGALLLHVAAGMTRPGDVDHCTCVRSYRALAQRYYEADRLLLAMFPLARRLAGPREALWHALIARNYGANHLLVTRGYASPGVDTGGEPFYTANSAQALVERHSEELGVGIVPFRELGYMPGEARYVEVDGPVVQPTALYLSGDQARERYLDHGEPLPAWFARPEVAEILTEGYPPRHRQGVCIWLTGLSGAGKSTTAEVLTVLLLEHGRQVTLLDGDVVRTHLSKGLGFSRADRDINIRRIGFVAAEIVRHGGVVVCAAVSPYRATRNDVRGMVGSEQFVEVFVDTPLEVCEARDVKGMYAKARRGEIKGFTGVDDPYEPPENPELRLDTVSTTAEENAHRIVTYLLERDFLRSDSVVHQGEPVALTSNGKEG